MIVDEKARIVALRQALHEYNYRYYVLNQPIVSDQEFDFMMHELQDLDHDGAHASLLGRIVVSHDVLL